MRRLAKLLLVSSMTLLSAPVAFGQSPRAETLADINRIEGPSRQQRLLEGAKKEGEMAIYESMTAEDINPIIDAFMKKYGIKVKVWRSSSENVLERVINEARGGRFEVDVVENNAPEMEALHPEKLLQPLSSPYFEQLMPQAIPAHKEWVGHTIDVFVLKLKGAPIEWFVMQPAVAQFRSLGLTRKAPHPCSSVLFLDFMLTEGEQISFNRKYVPTNTKLDAPLARQPLKFIDPALAVDMQEPWRKMYEDVVIKRVKP